jgi:hypothetical protein
MSSARGFFTPTPCLQASLDDGQCPRPLTQGIGWPAPCEAPCRAPPTAIAALVRWCDPCLVGTMAPRFARNLRAHSKGPPCTARISPARRSRMLERVRVLKLQSAPGTRPVAALRRLLLELPQVAHGGARQAEATSRVFAAQTGAVRRCAYTMGLEQRASCHVQRMASQPINSVTMNSGASTEPVDVPLVGR